MHTVVPRSGVRYELTLVEGAESEARYDAVVFTHELTGRARVCIRRDGASLEGPSEDIGEAHLAQLEARIEELLQQALTKGAAPEAPEKAAKKDTANGA